MTEDIGDLVRAAQGGDTVAMNDLLDRLAPYVGRICAPIALANAADAAQEALIAVFRSLPGLREPEAVFGWARTIAVREAIKVSRAAERQVPADLTELPARTDPQTLVDLWDTLARMSPEHRAVLVLRDLEGLDERAVAALLDVPAGTAKSRLNRARVSFRKAWRA
ncbi:sigma-70 family RNA polymerase sigma factor [Kribbella sp. NPDC051770]|uniref:RNA polymerase sigma factor n=1 Tax=Kribbella sp. NPDC051770 TaxID=3155413 RepID=UPI0034264AA0